MEAIFILIPISIGIIFVALITFVWSVNNGQYDDLEKEAERILLDDDLTNDVIQDKNQTNELNQKG